MLHYLGPNVGPQGPVSQTLPPALPGTMPGGVPGVAPSPAPLPPSMPMHASHGGHIHKHGEAGPLPPALLAAIAGKPMGAPGMNGAPQPAPLPEYGTTTQEDGSILLHMKNPDGSLGPVVKVLPPIKPRAAGAPSGAGGPAPQ